MKRVRLLRCSFVTYRTRICSSLTPRIQTLLKPTVCLLLMTRCTSLAKLARDGGYFLAKTGSFADKQKPKKRRGGENVKRGIPPGGPLQGQAVVATCSLLVSCSQNQHSFRCGQIGPPARRCRRSVLALLLQNPCNPRRFAYTSFYRARKDGFDVIQEKLVLDQARAGTPTPWTGVLARHRAAL